jgi:hypothetical protein
LYEEEASVNVVFKQKVIHLFHFLSVSIIS